MNTFHTRWNTVVTLHYIPVISIKAKTSITFSDLLLMSKMTLACEKETQNISPTFVSV